MTPGLLDKNFSDLIQIMGGNPSDYNMVNQPMPNQGLLYPQFLAEYTPNVNVRMLSDEQLFNQNFDNLTNEEIVQLEAEQSRRSARQIEELKKKAEEEMELQRLNEIREDYF